MDLDLTETESLLRDTVRSFLEREVPYDRIRELEKEGAADRVLWKDVAAQGWVGVSFPEACGGAGGSLVEAGLLVEEFARRAAIVPVLEVIAAGRVLEAHAGGALLEQVVAGNAIPVPAIFEGPGADSRVGARHGRGVLSGEKTFVDYGSFATHHLVSARDDSDIGLYLVDAAAKGVHFQALRSIGRTPLCNVRYENVASERVGGSEELLALIRLGRCFAAIQCVGAMQQALDMTVAYANVREQFGKTISTFQAVRHHAANMAIRVTSARHLAYEALDAEARGVATDAQVAAAKASASRAAPEVTMLAHQIHGGNGVIEENDLYFYTLRAKEASLAWGSVDACLDAVAADVHIPADWF